MEKTTTSKHIGLKLTAGILLSVVLGGLFYWYEWRPSQARVICEQEVKAFMQARTDGEQTPLDWQRLYDLKYSDCLNGKGIKN
jgi:hypothetical protein